MVFSIPQSMISMYQLYSQGLEMSVMTLGDRPLLQLQANDDSETPIKAIKVTKIGNLDVIFILTVCNQGKQNLEQSLRDAMPTELIDAVSVSDSTFLYPSNVVVMSVRVPISGPLVTPSEEYKWFNAVAQVLNKYCNQDYPDLQLHLKSLIHAERPIKASERTKNPLLFKYSAYSATAIHGPYNDKPNKPKPR